MSRSAAPDLSAMADLLALMVKLRDPLKGCPWDRVQTFASIAPYTLEEAYELVDAIQSGDPPPRLRDELGDLLFQVVFYAQLAQERGWFDFDGIARAIHDKLVRRHPHLFGEPAVPWEDLKAHEREAAATVEDPHTALGVLADVPRALPALTRAQKLGKRAGRVGFDWTDMRDVRAKITEELAELDEAVLEAGTHPDLANPPAHLVEEMGDLLFAIANWGRHVGADAEGALRAANAKFERRFASMEALARERALVLSELTLAHWEALWLEAKDAERGRTG
ncbi:MAG TPA: nucleoside triphosphate pyrophosphohydrolase [Steroidobacteraceae bacterium]|jgi:ATP diphosphatase|nr:nucleoside triphosphate pyrophosphohydrolase [Steroidobacteraceae bacterium]